MKSYVFILLTVKFCGAKPGSYTEELHYHRGFSGHNELAVLLLCLLSLSSSMLSGRHC